MVWDAKNTQGNEAGKIKYEIVEYTRGKVLDIGCGPFKPFKHFIGIDNRKEWGDLPWKADLHMDCVKGMRIFQKKYFDAVFSSHLLEHIENTEEALKEWWRVIKNDGYLILYLPHKDFYPNIGQENANRDHKHDFLPEDIIDIMKGIGYWELLVNESRNQDEEYSFLQVYKKKSKYCYTIRLTDDELRNPPLKDGVPLWKPLGKKAAIVRYGAFGDMIVLSSILPWLKEQGYHITIYGQGESKGILENDPNIDAWHIQDKDQVPMEELRNFWEVHKKRFDKWINLTESVETTLLPVPGMSIFDMPVEARHKVCNVNYLEFTHDIAEVPFPIRQKFYPTEDEIKWAKKEKSKIGDNVILWTLSGSSFHKAYPARYMDSIIATLLVNLPNWSIILVGDLACKILEYPWVEEPRVFCKSGEWSIRQTLTFAEISDIVIGPETGVLNSVGMLPIPKIVFLSHSSKENLTKHWIETTSLEPIGCKCYPCHMLHNKGSKTCIDVAMRYNPEYAPDKDVGAYCQLKIEPERVLKSIYKYIEKKETSRIWRPADRQTSLSMQENSSMLHLGY